MGFYVSSSPGINISEIDLTTVVPTVSTTEGALAGVFKWGPVEQTILIESEKELIKRFGKPSDFNPETWFTAANFLSYGNKLFVVRAASTSDCASAIANSDAITVSNSSFSNLMIKNIDDYESKVSSTGYSADTDLKFIAKYPGQLGNSLKISICPSVNAYSGDLYREWGILHPAISNGYITTFTIGSANVTVTNISNSSLANTATGIFTIGDIIRVGNSSLGYQEMKLNAVSSTGNASEGSITLQFDSRFSLSANLTANGTLYYNNSIKLERYWEFYKNVERSPGTSTYANTRGGSSDELHIVVVDEDGAITGTPDQILEVYDSLSRATDAVSTDGSVKYYKEVLNQYSEYVWWANHPTGLTTNTASSITALNIKPINFSFSIGADGANESAATMGALTSAYDKFKSAENIDISLIMQGKARGTNGTQLANYIIDNICEVRKDCVLFVSPEKTDVVQVTGREADNVREFRQYLNNSSYAFMDSGYKWQYDKYNDLFRYIPLNGDIAGLAVRTDSVRDPWFSIAGFNRGYIKNIAKLAYNPTKAERDILYKADVNPVVTFPGQGTVLFGDKTLLGKPSAFDRINVRRLFIVLEKSIALAARASLFEFNDEFTRAQFRNLVEPFLRDIQGRRGIYDYKVVCDETNNTGEVIDRNEFIGDIYIKPARSINFIQLNFVAVRTGVEFTEIVGQF